VGSAYEKIKKQYHRAMQREENSKHNGGDTPKHIVADSTDSEDAEDDDVKDKEDHSTDY
jgi:hypothetical protein